MTMTVLRRVKVECENSRPPLDRGKKAADSAKTARKRARTLAFPDGSVGSSRPDEENDRSSIAAISFRDKGGYGLETKVMMADGKSRQSVSWSSATLVIRLGPTRYQLDRIQHLIETRSDHLV